MATNNLMAKEEELLEIKSASRISKKKSNKSIKQSFPLIQKVVQLEERVQLEEHDFTLTLP